MHMGEPLIKFDYVIVSLSPTCAFYRLHLLLSLSFFFLFPFHSLLKKKKKAREDRCGRVGWQAVFQAGRGARASALRSWNEPQKIGGGCSRSPLSLGKGRGCGDQACLQPDWVGADARLAQPLRWT